MLHEMGELQTHNCSIPEHNALGPPITRSLLRSGQFDLGAFKILPQAKQ
jgi:hypothetical protein